MLSKAFLVGRLLEMFSGVQCWLQQRPVLLILRVKRQQSELLLNLVTFPELQEAAAMAVLQPSSRRTLCWNEVA